jgi:hypothetical protein
MVVRCRRQDLADSDGMRHLTGDRTPAHGREVRLPEVGHSMADISASAKINA